MIKRALSALPVLLWVLSVSAGAQPSLDFAFGVIAQPARTSADTMPLDQALAESDADNLAFVAVDGFKRADEPCSDALYNQRFALLSGAKNGVILVPAGSDWSDCRNPSGRVDGLERLERLRELFYPDEFSLGASKIPLIRQSITPKFRLYAENMRWDVGSVLFTSLNLPSNNNRYRTDAGRNSEFEDRAVATRDWLRRSFANAKFKNMAGIVLICDGDPLSKPAKGIQHDGFADVRQQLTQLAAKFPGKVLVIHNHVESKTPQAQGIVWRGNLGELELSGGWTKVAVKLVDPTLFSVTEAAQPNPAGK
ncbi:MAG TPA: hypothetical protein VF472_11380 [Burkholderiaceae bacterium]